MTVATARRAGELVGASTRIELSAAGDVQAIRHGDSTLVNQYVPTPHDAMVGGVFLRRHTPQGTVESVVLVGARADGTFTLDDRCARWSGRALGAQYSVTLTLDPDGVFWVWRVDLSDDPTGAGSVPDAPSTYDVVLAQDVALAPESMSMSSEPYISQYVVHHVIDAERAVPTIASRQTMATAPVLPLALTAVIEGAQAHLTDGFSFYGLGAKVDGHAAALDVASWESLIYQYEFAMPTLLGRRIDLTAPRTVHAVTAFVPDYRGELADARDAVPHLFDRAVALAGTTAPVASPGTERLATGVDEEGGREDLVPPAGPGRSLLVSARLLAGRELTDDALVGLTAPTPTTAPTAAAATTATTAMSPTTASTARVLRPETAPDGTLLSYFTPEATHVVSRAKELLVERPHGHVLKAGADVTPNANVLSATAYAYGVFASHVVVGNTSANRFVSVQRNHLNLLRSSGVRVLARIDGEWRLLGVPSALVMDLGGLHWVYATDAGRIDVRTIVLSDARGLELRVEAEQALDLLVTVDVELGAGQWSATSELDGRALAFTADAGTDVAEHCPDLAYVIATATGRLGGDAVLFPDGRSRDTPVVTVRFDAVTNASVVLTGDLEGTSPALRVARTCIDHPLDVEAELAAHRAYVAAFTRHLHVDGHGRLAELNLLLPWFTQNALVHFLVPHGLEQYSGAAWGTRDVCQGPLELNLAFGHHDTVRDIVLRVFAHQFDDGTLPQWFMLDSYAERYQDDAHGDVVVWPLVALGEYLAATGDTAVLDATIPFWDHAHRRAGTVPVPVAEHVRRSLDYIRAHRAPGTRLLSYGEGDWDDTLQPAQSSMKEEMASAWTVALLYQATRTLEDLLRGTAHTGLAAELGTEADTIVAEFTDRFVIDGVLAGYVVFAPEGPWPVIHPSDDRTGLHYRLIPMTRSIIAGLFTPDQALRHEALVEEHLHFPDGVRLMDRPAPFHDGITRFFRRGEQAANFGREVGLMYTHAHVRYTQALATLGRDRLVAELLRISPVGQSDRLATSAPRQRNCYYSSSDGAFSDRYDAAAHFDRLRSGTIGVKGGWRVYSSGPGIYLRQVVHGALGIVERAGAVVFDPVLALEDDGTTIGIDLGGFHRTVRYHIEAGNAPVRVELDGVPVPGVEVAAVYRRGGLRVAAADLRGTGEAPSGVIDVYVGDDRRMLHG